jgi:two-component system sensor histidine kinase UhpB
MADMSNDSFYLVDSGGRFLYVNDRAAARGGYTRDELLGMTVSDINPDFPPARFAEFVAAVIRGLAPMQFETISRRKDGSLYPIELSIARIDVDGEIYMFGVVRDITERKQMENAQKSFTQRMLQTLEAERQRVARELHDDVGQAIATVGVLLHTLEDTSGSLPAETRPALVASREAIRRITESVARLVRDYHPADLLGLGLEDTLRSHATQFAHRHRLTLRLATAPVAGLLSADDELHLYRIVQEALANVARHASATRVAVRLARDGRRVTVRVRDNGIGFVPERPPASGLGLVTMRERASLLRGELHIDSHPGRGTEVRVTVPVVGATAARAPRSAPRPAPPRTRRATAGAAPRRKLSRA